MKSRILIVDDILENRKLLASIIKEHTDHEIIIAKSGLDVVSMMKNKQLKNPDLILLDVMMPEMNGFDVASVLKHNRATMDIPIIFITGLADTESKIKGFEAGGADYISKPFNKLELLARINTHLKLKRNEDALRQKNIQLEEMNRKKNMFLGIAAHDLRNPLMTISGLSELFLMKYEGHLQDDQVRFLNTIKRSTDFMTALVDDFLDYSAIESGKLTLNKKETDIAELIRSNIDYNQSLAERKKISLEFYYGENLPSKVLMDGHKIQQVLNNLIHNAIKFSHSESKIEVRVEYKDNMIVFSVKDEGQGIPEAEQSKLFAPFSKISVKGTAGEGSTGLGLAIVKKIVNGHNGEIQVESQPGKGTTFIVTIPTYNE